MATRKKKPWNADKVLFPELQTGVPHVPKPTPETVTPGHSTTVHGPLKEKTQPKPSPAEKK